MIPKLTADNDGVIVIMLNPFRVEGIHQAERADGRRRYDFRLLRLIAGRSGRK